jgi:hypothetical protein
VRIEGRGLQPSATATTPRFVTLLVREIASHGRLFLAALACGLSAASIPVLLRGNPDEVDELQFSTALALGLSWMTFVAIGLGATCLTREMDRGGPSFDLSRPVTSTGTWLARLLGAYLSVLLVGALAFYPSTAARTLPDRIPDLLASLIPGVSSTRISQGWISPMPWVLSAAIVLLLLISNFVRIVAMTRDRSSLLSLAAFAVSMPVALRWVGKLQEHGAVPEAHRLLVGLLATCVGALALASHRQWVRGRVDSVAAGRAFAGALGAALGFAGLASVLFAEWYTRPSPRALDPGAIEASELTPRWVFVSGAPRGRRLPRRFLLDPVTGIYLRLGPTVGLDQLEVRDGIPRRRLDGDAGEFDLRSPRRPIVSRDGSTITWLESRQERSIGALLRRSLEVRIGRDGPVLASVRAFAASSDRVIETAMPIGPALPAVPSGWDITDDGERVALLAPSGKKGIGTLEVMETNSGASSASLELDECDRPGALTFGSSTRLRLSCGEICCVSHGAPDLDLREIDLDSGLVVRRRGRFDPRSRGHVLRVDVDGIRFHVAADASGQQPRWERFPRSVPARSSAVDPPLGTREWRSPAEVRRLTDGGLFMTLESTDGSALATYGLDGRVRWWSPLPDHRLRLLEPPRHDGTSKEVVVEAITYRWERRGSTHRPLPEERRYLRVDPATGSIVETTPPPPPARPTAARHERRLRYFSDREYHWVDPRTGRHFPLPVGRHFRLAADRRRSTALASTAFLEPAP